MTKLKKISVPIYKYTNKYDNTVKKVKIIKQTDLSVFFKNGGRCLKTTQDGVYRDTIQEVLVWIETKLKKRYDDDIKRCSYYKGKLDKFLEYKKVVENGTSKRTL